MAGKTVAIGGRYARAGHTPNIYVVTDVVQKTGHALHARLALEGGLPGEQILVGVSALGDRRLWRQVA